MAFNEVHMSKKVVVRSAISGTSANSRRILAGVTATTAAPSSIGDGIALQRNEFIHLLFKVAGTDPVFTVQVWWYSPISGMWHQGEAMNVNASDIATIEVQGLSQMYLQVTAVSGTSPVLDAWVGLVVPV
jgi:hypothetical protein